MNYAVEMSSGAIIYIPSFIKIGSGIKKLIEGSEVVRIPDYRSRASGFNSRRYQIF
jgi:hypothetical protein